MCLISVFENYFFDNFSAADTENMFCEFFDEVYDGQIPSFLSHRTPSQLLADNDPIAFRCGLSDYISFELGETLIEIACEYYYKTDLEQAINDFQLADYLGREPTEEEINIIRNYYQL